MSSYRASDGAAAALNAPLVQVMMPDLELREERGVVVRQAAQVMDAVGQVTGCCYQPQTRFTVSSMPPGKRAAKNHDVLDPDRWSPTHEELERLPPAFVIEEQSQAWVRTCLALWGGLNLRPMTMHMRAKAGREDIPDHYTIQRPWRCGGRCCCPLEMSVFARHRGEGADLVGRVEEFWPRDLGGYCSRCFQTCCCCTTTHNVLALDKPRGALVHKYSLRTDSCCCGRNNNCCGSTCLKKDLIMDVLDASGAMVGNMQKTYAPGGGAGACCRCMFQYGNFIVDFPEAASEDERALLLTALLNTEFQLWERQGGE